MKTRHVLIAMVLLSSASSAALAQVAGSTLIGVAAAELRTVAVGWSAKRQVLGQAVFNEKEEKIGTIDDVVISPEKAVSYAIVNAGGFIGVTKHDVAIPVEQLKLANGKLVLEGASREALKASPPFEYSAN
ncbi:PRC-barrel domain-containing protein [Bradyrhizobium genosp. A]|uniref:PRC-barrel domain-containing protein n=1 Tax=Bradyrhizobium genosp. A TaxID=83626 RepID=UPI003CE7A96A